MGRQLRGEPGKAAAGAQEARHSHQLPLNPAQKEGRTGHGRYMCLMGSDDGYETVQVPERKLATFGVGIARLEEWIEEGLTGQKRLPGLA